MRNVLPRRIVHVSPSYAREDGGPSEVLRGLLPALQQHSEVKLVTTDKLVRLNEAPPDVPTVISRAYPPHRLTVSPGIYRSIVEVGEWADLIHVHGFPTFPSSAALHYARTHNKPVILQPHGSLDMYHWRKHALGKQAYRALVDRRNLGAIKAVVASSERECAGTRRAFPSTPTYEIPLGVSFPAEDRPNFGVETRMKLLFLGRVAHKKRLDLVIASLRQPGLLHSTLTVAGPLGSDLDYSPEDVVTRLGLSDRVSFLGQVDAETRTRLMHSHGVFVLPSEDESFGVAAAEAMAHGLPVVLSANVGIAAAASNSGAAQICDLKPDSVAEAVLNVQARWSQMSRAATRHAESCYRWEAIAQRFAGLYKVVLS